ncbi:putative GPI-anchored protein pfl2 isoform X1 [Aristolochia californica]|uniref:putative GPI-anchored protein pfl2 isoform X1 n=1 Tax=Aristolochia californica TaxID=171875 RepID=UPI0035E3130A
MDDDKLNRDIDRRLSLIDVSSVDDCLIDSVSDASFLLRSSVTGLPQKMDPECIGIAPQVERLEEPARVKISKQMELLPLVSELSGATQIGKAPKCNLRKSLAWDNAFFTSEGVLDADELAMVTKAFKKAAPALPGIEEDLRRSAESNTTVGSESWALESLEVDLFDHLRASVRYSGDESDKASDVSSCRSKAGPSKPGLSSCSTSKRQNLASQSKIKHVPSASKRQSIHNQSLKKISEEALSHLHNVQGPNKSRDQKPPLKPPKILSRTSPLPSATSKRTSLASPGPSKSKINCGDAGNRQLLAVSAKPVPPSSIPTPKSSSSSGLPKLAQSRSGGPSFMSIGKFTSRISGNKAESRNSTHPSTCSTIKTPIRSSMKKVENGKINASLRLMPSSKLSTVSPASSIDGMSSSESSSSTPTAKQRMNNSKIRLHAGSSFSAGNALESVPLQLTDLGQSEDKGMALGNEVAKRVPQSSAMDSLRSGLQSTSSSRLLKPSGLRLPSPKIGFFDVDKLVPRASSGSLHSHTIQPSNRLKSAAAVGNLGEALKPKSYNKLQADFSASDMKPATTSPMQKQSNSSPATIEEVNMSAELHVSETKYCDQHPDFELEQHTSQNAQKNNEQVQPVEQVHSTDINSNSTYKDEFQVLLEAKSGYNEQTLDQLSSIGNFNVDEVKNVIEQQMPSLSALDSKNSTSSTLSELASHSRELTLHGTKVISSIELTFPAVLGIESPSVRTPLSVNPYLGNANGSFALAVEGIKQIDKMVDPTSTKVKERPTEEELKQENLQANTYCEVEPFWSEKENNQESNCYSLSLPQQQVI